MNSTTSKIILIPLAIFILTALIYWPGIKGPFLFDDATNILNNSTLEVRTLDPSNLYIAAISGDAGPLKRPVAMLSFALNYYFAGSHLASAYKITNIIILCISALLLFTLNLQLFKQLAITTNNPKYHLNAFWYATITCIIWTSHPINLTSVLYIVQRMTSLSTFFSLGCIIFYLSARNHWLHHAASWRVISLFIASITSLLLALFSKENAVVTPLLILLIELILYLKEKPWSHIQKAPKQLQLIGLGILTVFFLGILLWAIDYASGGFNSRPFTMLERVLTESRILCFYISLILIPRINSFGLFHDDIALSSSLFSPWTTITSITFILGLLTIAFYYRKRNPLFALGVGWFFIGHLLESTFFPLEIAHEHRNNLPSIGIIIAAISLIPANLITSKKVTLGVFFVTLTFGSITYLRAHQWSNKLDQAYFEAIHHPNSPSAQYTYSSIALREGKINEAFSAIQKAIALSPTEAAFLIHFQRYLAQGGIETPPEIQKKTLLIIRDYRITPTSELVLDKLTDCFAQNSCLRLLPNYLEWIEEILKKKPNNSFYHLLKGKASFAIGDEKTAIRHLTKAHSLDKKYLQPLFEIFNIHIKNKDYKKASLILKQLKKANEVAPITRYKEIISIENMIPKPNKSQEE